MGGWLHSSLEPADCVFKLQPINRGTRLRGRSQSVAEPLLLTASQARGSRLLDHRSSASGIQDQRIREAAVELQMHGFSSGKPETIM